MDIKKLVHKKWLFCIIAIVTLVLNNSVHAENPPALVAQWGGVGTGNGQFYTPSGVAVDSSGNVYITDRGSEFALTDHNNQRVQKFNSSGAYITKWGGYGTGDGMFKRPYDVAVDSNNNVYVVDTSNERIQKFTSSGTFISKWGSLGSGNGQFNTPTGIAIDNSNNVYVVDSGNNRVQKFSSSGAYLTQWRSGAGVAFDFPSDIAIDMAGYVYVSNTQVKVIEKFTSNGTYIRQWPSSVNNVGPVFLTSDSTNSVYVTFTMAGYVYNYPENATLAVASWQAGGPEGIATDRKGTFYIADGSNSKIYKYSYKNLCGNIGGRSLRAVESPYTLTCAAKVEKGATLYIEPGVVLNYNGNSLTVEGTLTWGK